MVVAAKLAAGAAVGARCLGEPRVPRLPPPLHAVSPCPSSWSPGTNLPVVLGAVAALGSVLGGLADGVQDIGVLVGEGHIEELGHLVPHLSGIGVSLEGVDVVASASLHARQLGLVSSGET